MHCANNEITKIERFIVKLARNFQFNDINSLNKEYNIFILKCSKLRPDLKEEDYIYNDKSYKGEFIASTYMMEVLPKIMEIGLPDLYVEFEKLYSLTYELEPGGLGDYAHIDFYYTALYNCTIKYPNPEMVKCVLNSIPPICIHNIKGWKIDMMELINNEYYKNKEQAILCVSMF